MSQCGELLVINKESDKITSDQQAHERTKYKSRSKSNLAPSPPRENLLVLYTKI